MEIAKPYLKKSVQPEFNEPVSFLQELASSLGVSGDLQELRENEMLLSLASLVLEVRLDSESPFFKFLEQQPCRVNIDKLEKKHYLLSGTIKDLRLLYQELKEQKVAKALLIFLCNFFPSLFEDLWPKRGLVQPLGIEFSLLPKKEFENLDLSIKLRHAYFLSTFQVAFRDLSYLYELDIKPVILEKMPETYVLTQEESPVKALSEKLFNLLQEFPEDVSSLFYPVVYGVKGFLYQPLIQYMAFLTRFLAEEKHPLREASLELLAELKEIYPEPFGLIPV
ncbi:hypothetical protein Thein_1614 [Thermodesulfatator indicus DSM 15286]|uniref:Uncharacterized protein n=1 Tax=Thermodesulfatator indicus (strain DSM 15286 / JCM 11887 / CIR29812) TaxID=667014 RepID=F8AAW1_THEID|nr:hypothetical protein [Thermodesulfatator indicus]AEH45474.1 hypothetical protein Thein_1614 [Thermodesulfatator indicus DSM 15286]